MKFVVGSLFAFNAIKVVVELIRLLHMNMNLRVKDKIIKLDMSNGNHAPDNECMWRK